MSFFTVNMATRSGKTYHQELKGSRKRTGKDVCLTPNIKCSEDDLDGSSTQNRDPSRRSSVKNSTLDKTNGFLKLDVNNSTESNWIVSDLSTKKPKRIMRTDTDESKKDEPKSKSVKKTSKRKKKQLTDDSSFNKSDELATHENISNGNIPEQKIETNTNIKVVEDNIENDINSLNVQKKQKKSKKKNKSGKKNNLKRKPKEEKDESRSDDTKVVNTTFEKEKNNTVVNNNTDVTVSKTKATNFDLNNSNVSNKEFNKRKSSLKNTTFETPDTSVNTTFEKTNKLNGIMDKTDNIINITYEKPDKPSDTTFEKSDIPANTTFDKEDRPINTTFDKDDKPVDTTYEKDDVKNTMYEKYDEQNRTLEKDLDFNHFNTSRRKTSLRKSSVAMIVNKIGKDNDTLVQDLSISLDTSRKLKKSISDVFVNTSKMSNSLHENVANQSLRSPFTKRMSLRRQTIDITQSPIRKINSTLDKISKSHSEKKSRKSLQVQITQILNTTFEKGDTNPVHNGSKSSLISSDNSTVSRVSITSDDSSENIINTSPVLIESSMDETVKESPEKSLRDIILPQTPLKREGTFTKDAPEVQSPQTPGKNLSVLVPAAGCTPYHVTKSSQKTRLNVTRSVEKRMSGDISHRMTRVMFCSPIDNPVAVAQDKKKVIKSNLKGSNKSFVFDESASISRPARKRSYTHNDAEDSRVKRSRLAEDLQHSVDRLSRPRTASVNSKLTTTITPKKSNPPRSKSEINPARTRLPNFAALHQKQFDKMESLGECQERKAKRARQMLTPTGSKNLIEKISPKYDSPKQATKEIAKTKEKSDTPSKKNPTSESTKPGFTRFGFKLNLDVNPFSIPSTNKPQPKPLNGLTSKVPLPSIAGTTASVRRVTAKQTVMREKSFLEKRRTDRSENRTIIKGVRTNRRFELQMKLRNVE